MFKKSSYQTMLLILAFTGLLSTSAMSAEIYLDPNPVFLTGAVGDSIHLELKIDANTLGVRLYQVFIKYQPDLIDTVSSSLGPLFENSGFGTFFSSKVVYDTVTGDTAIRMEALLLGSSAVVDGPGTVGMITFQIKTPGIADLSILRHVMTDINNDTIPSTSSGSIAYMLTPPDSFDLLSPFEGESITKFPGEYVDLTWEATQSVYPSETVSYDLQYGTTISFAPATTVTITGLIGTTYSILADGLSNDTYYWRVIAQGNTYGFERQSTPWPGSFDFTFGALPPLDFDLLNPPNGELNNLFGETDVIFSWEESIGAIPGDIVGYTVYIGIGSNFPADALLTLDAGTNEFIAVSKLSLPYCTDVFWTVKATSQFDLSNWATSVFSSLLFTRGDLNCSGGESPVNISDLTMMVDFMFKGGDPPSIVESGNLNCSTGETIMNITDLTFFVDYLFRSGPPPDC